MKTGLWRAVVVAGALSLVAAACAPSATPSGASPGAGTAAPKATAEQPQPGGRIVVGSFVDIQRLNPSNSNDTGSTAVSSNGKIIGGIGNTITIGIKPGLLKWKEAVHIVACLPEAAEEIAPLL